jgi:enamine deaminase RidA (YjgF/YER057c/UK114 family)
MTIERNQKTPIMHRFVAHGGVVHFGGVLAGDLSVGMEEQTRQVTRRLDELLAAAGTDRTRILSAMLYITDMSQKAAMNKAWTEWIPEDHLPARATIGVSDLGENVLIEVVITAASD